MPSPLISSNRRELKNFVLEPRAQLKMALWIFANGFIFTALLCAGMMSVLDVMTTNLSALSPSTKWVLAIELENGRHQIWVLFGFFTLASILGASLIAIKITHRYLGPMQAMRRYLRALVDGTATQPFALREGDPTNLVPEINELARKMYPEKF